jgi:hypothetical protein
MNLSAKHFYSGSFNFRRCANGPMETVTRYSYESGGTLYDVIAFRSEDGGLVCRVNGFTVKPELMTPHQRQMFNAIGNHFALSSAGKSR